MNRDSVGEGAVSSVCVVMDEGCVGADGEIAVGGSETIEGSELFEIAGADGVGGELLVSSIGDGIGDGELEFESLERDRGGED